MRWAFIDRKEEKWFVRTARIFAWLLVIPYAVLWVGRIAYVIREAPEIYSWISQHTLQEFLDGPGLFVALALVPDFLIGIPAILLFGFVKTQTQKKEPKQSSEPTLTAGPFSVAPPPEEPRPTTVVSVARF